MSSTKSSTARHKVCLPTALASLNSGQNFDLRACCVGVRFLFRPNLVPVRPLRFRSVAWRSSFVANLNSIALGHVPVVGAEACVVACHYHVVATTLACNLIWPCNSFVLNCYTNSFSISPSLALKLVRHRLSLRSSYLGMSARDSIARLTTWRTFLAITMVHLGFSANVTLAVTTATTSLPY